MIHLKEWKQMETIQCRKSPNGKHWLVDDVRGKAKFVPGKGIVDKQEIHVICAYCGVEFGVEPDPVPDSEAKEIPF